MWPGVREAEAVDLGESAGTAQLARTHALSVRDACSKVSFATVLRVPVGVFRVYVLKSKR